MDKKGTVPQKQTTPILLYKKQTNLVFCPKTPFTGFGFTGKGRFIRSKKKIPSESAVYKKHR